MREWRPPERWETEARRLLRAASVRLERARGLWPSYPEEAVWSLFLGSELIVNAAAQMAGDALGEDHETKREAAADYNLREILAVNLQPNLELLNRQRIRLYDGLPVTLEGPRFERLAEQSELALAELASKIDEPHAV